MEQPPPKEPHAERMRRFEVIQILLAGELKFWEREFLKQLWRTDDPWPADRQKLAYIAGKYLRNTKP